jgi:F420-0:gamma-glutamyl ligase-like protein
LILDNTQKLLRDNDIVVISEKALSVAKGNIIDEGKVKPGLLAKILATLWMRFIWGRFLGKLCKFRVETIKRLRNYPPKQGAAHKQAVLQYAGFIHALKYGSEGGIDLSNLPFSYACLPLDNPREEAERIRREIGGKTGKKVTVIISDTDSTFSFHNFHFTSRPNPIRGIKSFGGALSFILGRALGLRQRATPLAVIGSTLGVEEALNLGEVSHHVRGYGAGRTVWDMTQRFGVEFSEVTWETLDKVDHFPIVLIRRTGISSHEIN